MGKSAKYAMLSAIVFIYLLASRHHALGTTAITITSDHLLATRRRILRTEQPPAFLVPCSALGGCAGTGTGTGPCVAPVAHRPRWERDTATPRRRRRGHPTASVSMSTNGYKGAGPPQQNGQPLSGSGSSRQSGLVNGANLKLTTIPGIDRGGHGHVDPEVVCSAPPPPATSEVDFKVAVEGSPHFAHLLDGVESKSTELLQHFEPLERIALTANGNLQRVISAYYDSPVTVDIRCSTQVAPRVFHREVSLSVMGQTCCVAKSIVVLHSPACVELASKGEVGIGQLFRFLDVLPRFELLNAGRAPAVPPQASQGTGLNGDYRLPGVTPAATAIGGGGIWRVYDLRSRHMSCRIHEEFSPGLFSLFAGVNGDGAAACNHKST